MQTVLVVDDDIAVAHAMASALSRAGFHVELAEDGLAGFDAAQRLHPSVVVTDWVMPRGDGALLCHLLLGEASLMHTPIVVFTSIQSLPEVPNPNVRYCRKPCAPETLIRTIAELLEQTDKP